MGLPFSVEWRTQVYGVGGVDSQRLSLGNERKCQCCKVACLKSPRLSSPGDWSCLLFSWDGVVWKVLQAWASSGSRREPARCTPWGAHSGLSLPQVWAGLFTPRSLGPWLSFHPTLGPGHHSGLPVVLRVRHVSFNLQFKENGCCRTCWGPWADVNCYF